MLEDNKNPEMRKTSFITTT